MAAAAITPTPPPSPRVQSSPPQAGAPQPPPIDLPSLRIEKLLHDLTLTYDTEYDGDVAKDIGAKAEIVFKTVLEPVVQPKDCDDSFLQTEFPGFFLSTNNRSKLITFFEEYLTHQYKTRKAAAHVFALFLSSVRSVETQCHFEGLLEESEKYGGPYLCAILITLGNILETAGKQNMKALENVLDLPISCFSSPEAFRKCAQRGALYLKERYTFCSNSSVHNKAENVPAIATCLYTGKPLCRDCLFLGASSTQK